ncbi:MAG: winged helix-turn-helix domain-containing protein, partial [Actinomycetales bacterium]
ALAEAVDAGMSYREVAAEVGVSPTSISAALKARG